MVVVVCVVGIVVVAGVVVGGRVLAFVVTVDVGGGPVVVGSAACILR